MKIFEWLYFSFYSLLDRIVLFHPRREELVKVLTIFLLSLSVSHLIFLIIYHIEHLFSISIYKNVGFFWLIAFVLMYYLLLVRIKHINIMARYAHLENRKKLLIFGLVAIFCFALIILFKIGPYDDKFTWGWKRMLEHEKNLKSFHF